MRARSALTTAAGLGLATMALNYVPSVVSLGHWLPWRSLPGGWCRWRGPCVPKVAVTFDDGPSPVTTPRILDRLDELGLRATFFCLGLEVDRHPDLVAEIAHRGHGVATHGYAHERHLARTPRWIEADLMRSLSALDRVGVSPRWFRPPYGQTTLATMTAARRHHLELVLWSAWGREWTAPDVAEVVARVDRDLAPGTIVLLHDNDVDSPPGTAQRALDALGPIAALLERRGLRGVSLDELVSPS